MIVRGTKKKKRRSFVRSFIRSLVHCVGSSGRSFARSSSFVVVMGLSRLVVLCCVACVWRASFCKRRFIINIYKMIQCALSLSHTHTHIFLYCLLVCTSTHVTHTHTHTSSLSLTSGAQLLLLLLLHFSFWRTDYLYVLAALKYDDKTHNHNVYKKNIC